MKNIPLLRHAFAAVALALLAAGCGTTKTYFVVEPSLLNHALVYYTVGTNELLMMEFHGSGYCVMRRANDPKAANPYSTQPHAMRETRREFTPDEVNAIFQSLVLEGVCDKEPKDDRPLEAPYASFYGSIQNTRFQRLSRTPELLELAGWMAALFEHDQPGRREPQPR